MMRPQQKPNRTRGRGNRKPSGNNANRVYESNGPEGKVRGTPQQIIEKYLSLARDAQTSGNRVVAENFLQHAEHYQRLLVEAMGVQPERSDNQQPGLNQHDGDNSDDFDSEPGGDETSSGSSRQRSDEPVQNDRQSVRQNDRQNDRPDNRRANGQEDGQGGRRGDRQPDNRAPRESEVSGLTTIDSGGPDTGSLLVDAEEVSVSQPRRRRRAPEQAKSPAPTPSPALAPAPETPPAQTEPTTEPQPK